MPDEYIAYAQWQKYYTFKRRSKHETKRKANNLDPGCDKAQCKDEASENCQTNTEERQDV